MKGYELLVDMKTIFFVLVAAIVVTLSVPIVPGQAEGKALVDQSISDAIDNEFGRDLAVPRNDIDILTDNGIVTLSGTVSNILAKERAARIAQTVRGVRAVVNEIKVVPLSLRSDWEIKEDVEDALLMDPAAESYEINVEVRDNKVTLSGAVDSWQEKQLAATVAKGVKGVRAITNNIVVDYRVTRPDHEIKREIEKALRWDALVDHALIDVEVKDGKVMLSGAVGSAAEKSEAIGHCWVAGVDSVDALNLQVKYWARNERLRGDKYVVKSEQELRDAVEDALSRDPRVDSFDVKTEVSGRTVTLRGKVDNLGAYRAAAQDARNTVGVMNVENRLKLRPVQYVSDETIAQRVRRALKRHPYVERYDIAVDAISGTVKLYGRVDTHFEKAQADEVASRVRGVMAVDNNIAVVEKYKLSPYNPYVDERDPSEYSWYHYQPRYPHKSDEQIKQEIEQELFWSPYVDADDVYVLVENGHAVLTGIVDSWSEYNAAAENAYEGGAALVENKLRVKPPK